MGLSFGGGSSSGTQQSNQNQNYVYSGPQQSLQSQLGGTLAQDLGAASSGSLSPGVLAGETSADNQINQSGQAALTRTQQQLAARGFGPSGQTGQATLQSALNTQNNIADETGVAQQQQQNLNTSNLLAALNYAFTSLGQNGSSSGSSSGSNFNWGASGAAAFGIP